MAKMTVETAISAFGAAAKSKLNNPAITGAPEDQLRAPLEKLIVDLADAAGFLSGLVSLVGETSLASLKTRPDYAVTVNHALVGFIEVKAPGKGADPRKFDKDSHDGKQWEKLKSLPNILYTDGNSFSLWQDGKLIEKVITLDGDIETSGAALKAPALLLPLISGFLRWLPQAPTTPKKLAEVSARLCRLLRDEVVETLAEGSEGLTALHADWRHLLFPQADAAQFADGYAQAVTFGLLVARARGIKLAKGIDPAAQELKKANSLIGTALRLLTEDVAVQQSLETSLKTLSCVLDVVDWAKITKSGPEAWLYFYEDFLEVYDNTLRKRTGSYYTPPEVVEAMVNLVDEALKGPLFERARGFASADVTVADPAVGTGTFLLGVLRQIAKTIEAEEGEGAIRAAIASAAQRIVGFELQFGPFAVAQLRIMAEMHALMISKKIDTALLPEPRLFITDTLGNPFIEDETLGRIYEPVAKSRREANKIKKEEKITVVIGNPPYKNQAGGLGGWIEKGSDGRPAPMDYWLPPAEWGLGANTHHLKNLYIYFWRWATLKVFGSGWLEATGTPLGERHGIVCFITASGFLNGPGFQKMREDLRRECSDIWVIDCSPEGHQPDVPTRIFQGVQQPVCIVVAARAEKKDKDEPAKVHFTTLPKGHREKKFEALKVLSLSSKHWVRGAGDWREPFLPAQIGAWANFPPLDDLFVWATPGVKTHRTWIIAPDALSLDRRWIALQKQNEPQKKEECFHPDDARNLTSVVKKGLGAFPTRDVSVAQDRGPVPPPCRYGFRTFDRQWIIPDHRLISRARPQLWSMYSTRQLFVTALEASSPKSGPGFAITALIPDHDHYKGSFGGRVYPLWRDDKATLSNIRPEVLALLAKSYGRPVTPEDVMAYIASVMAHPAFTKRFAEDLKRPGLRVPFTANAMLFQRAVELGREVIWLHCYGERFVDPDAGRPKKAPRLPKEIAPRIPAAGAIPGAPEPLPDDITYKEDTKRLEIGKGYVENVTKEMWEYEVSGKQVLKHWFSYRRRDRTRPIIGDRRPPSPLEKIQPESWPAEYTSDLIDLLNVLGRLIALEPEQAKLLKEICARKLIAGAKFGATAAVVLPEKAKKPKAGNAK